MDDSVATHPSDGFDEDFCDPSSLTLLQHHLDAIGHTSWLAYNTFPGVRGGRQCCSDPCIHVYMVINI